MAFNFAQASIQGRVGRDAEIHYTTGGKKVASFSVATGGGKRRDAPGDWPTFWWNISAWDEYADIAEKVRKGVTVHVKGRMSIDEWTDRTSGEKRSKLVITASAIEILTEDNQRLQSTQTAEVAAGAEDPFGF